MMDASILDFGTGITKIGIGGDADPLHVFRTTVTDGSVQGKEDQVPMKNGNVSNWDAMELIYTRSFELLGEDSTKRPALLSIPPMGSKLDRETSAKVLFEKVGIPSLVMVNNAELSLYQSGQSTGLVVNLGHGTTYVAPIWEHNIFSHAITHGGVTGSDIDNFLSALLNSNENAHQVTVEEARSIKESGACYVSQDFDDELNKDRTEIDLSYELPDGREILIGRERFLSCEALFNPEYIDKDSPPIHKLICDTVSRCDINIRRNLYSNIHIVGGQSLSIGLIERLQKEIQKKVPQSVEVVINAAENRDYAAWVGGSVFSQLSTFKNMLVTKADYEEKGISVLQNTCGV
ncbi:actin [Acrasis kona]|uniref:Actin n=1 Tax=Acrasis kona TaxID=1008807 RepID=A0AAW2YX58_9EUKA